MKKCCIMLIVLLLTLICNMGFAADISTGVITVEGTSNANQPAPNGYLAAKMDAQRNMLTEINGINIDAESTMEQFLLVSDVVKAKVQGLLKGAKVVNRYKDNEGYHVTLEIPVYGNGSIAESVMPAYLDDMAQANLGDVVDAYDVREDIFSNSQDSVVASTDKYTGLIIDCSGLDIGTAMSPSIYSSSNKLLNRHATQDRDMVIKRGILGYANGFDDNLSRAGSNPLVVRAVEIRHFVCPVVSDEDADRISSADRISGFIVKGNVIIIK